MYLQKLIIPVRFLRSHVQRPAKKTTILPSQTNNQEFWQDDLISYPDETRAVERSQKENKISINKNRPISEDVGSAKTVMKSSFISKFHHQELLDFDNLVQFPLKHSFSKISAENQFERLNDAVLPMWDVPYENQLKMKNQHIQNILYMLDKTLFKRKPRVSKKTVYKKTLPCKLDGIRFSKSNSQFRNTSEFSINVGIDGNPNTVGFYVGKPAFNDVTCVPPCHLVNLKESHKLVAKHYQSFIRSMPYNACLNYAEGGVWKNVLVRSTEDGELMIVAIINPRELNEEQIEDIQDQFKNYFLTGPGSECEATSLLFQSSYKTRSTNAEQPYKLLYGEPHIIETINDQEYFIKPDSFFQNNIYAATILFDAIKELVGVAPHATVLDTCCGTGAMGLQIAPFVRSVIGIDIVSSSIEDAKLNAEKNNLRNSVFFHGKFEELLPQLVKDFEHVSDVIAIVNPPKNGLNTSTIDMLRMCPVITKIIYISCRPAFVLKNFIGICNNKAPIDTKVKMPPVFMPTYAIPVDMFPHTPYTELVIMFERISSKLSPL